MRGCSLKWLEVAEKALNPVGFGKINGVDELLSAEISRWAHE